MGKNTVQEIKRAIDALTPEQLDELYLWLERQHPHPIDARIESDLQAGGLDKAIERALDDHAKGRSRPL